MKNNARRPLSPADTLFQTLGCRHSNPDICGNNLTPNKCAFAREDNLCLLPPRSWGKLLNVLKEGQNMNITPVEQDT